MRTNFQRLHPVPANDARLYREAAARVADQARNRAALLDENSAFPKDDIRALGDQGLLIAPFSARHGGAGLSHGAGAAYVLPLILRRIGAASLPLGRLYEGHVNAIGLVEVYGSAEQAALMAAEARQGALFGALISGAKRTRASWR